MENTCLTTYEKESNQGNSSSEEDDRRRMEVLEDSSWSAAGSPVLVDPSAARGHSVCSTTHGFLLGDDHRDSDVGDFLHFVGFGTQDFHVLGVRTQERKISR